MSPEVLSSGLLLSPVLDSGGLCLVRPPSSSSDSAVRVHRESRQNSLKFQLTLSEKADCH